MDPTIEIDYLPTTEGLFTKKELTRPLFPHEQPTQTDLARPQDKIVDDMHHQVTHQISTEIPTIPEIDLNDSLNIGDVQKSVTIDNNPEIIPTSNEKSEKTNMETVKQMMDDGITIAKQNVLDNPITYGSAGAGVLAAGALATGLAVKSKKQEVKLGKKALDKAEQLKENVMESDFKENMSNKVDELKENAHDLTNGLKDKVHDAKNKMTSSTSSEATARPTSSKVQKMDNSQLLKSIAKDSSIIVKQHIKENPLAYSAAAVSLVLTAALLAGGTYYMVQKDGAKKLKKASAPYVASTKAKTKKMRGEIREISAPIIAKTNKVKSQIHEATKPYVEVAQDKSQQFKEGMQNTGDKMKEGVQDLSNKASNKMHGSNGIDLDGMKSDLPYDTTAQHFASQDDDTPLGQLNLDGMKSDLADSTTPQTTKNMKSSKNAEKLADARMKAKDIVKQAMRHIALQLAKTNVDSNIHISKPTSSDGKVHTVFETKTKVTRVNTDKDGVEHTQNVKDSAATAVGAKVGRMVDVLAEKFVPAEKSDKLNAEKEGKVPASDVANEAAKDLSGRLFEVVEENRKTTA